MKFGNLHVPKGVIVWALTVKLHRDPEIWGPDVEHFNPERFIEGVNGVCKLPQVLIPFGFGPGIRLGQNLALAELKILIAMIVSLFLLSLSPK
ncbi:hypothetical protein MLD38_019012 [Melastoma candidum]|uniref:Uncharacterized protein n=1 Tax=Melastoma candidum TaxID=119954 RepID=A0ACB9QV20_9MYRT|nr:hypothetical protein MLD38_019012 [Melastoma candidum]